MTGVLTATPPAPTAAPARPEPEAAVGQPHTAFEDVFGMATGAIVVSLGLFLLRSGHAVTGGTAGIALLLSYATHLAFGGVYFVVNLPFLVLAYFKKGRSFTARTLIAVAAVSALTALQPYAISTSHLNRVYAVLLGNLLAGIGMLILFRHDSSVGGLNTVALIVQERFGVQAGWVQMTSDLCIILLALTVVPAHIVALSVAGAVLLNLVLAINHRPGRYLAI
ncbi:YitT family protein [Allobranchiibius sp. GilTou73]|uniref:YitT family protein n=1 Tax=Allobranchiibius sp. GilTou73 TaxID=2904523 RepID=UPI001F222E78|nr:YitT family protein [Allobranchiibius sp. GilTou73]UIJ35399.1 YitT family protein [Allobranchiibius sp. GilTou73]